MNNNFYAILRISPVANIATIRAAYRRAALSSHPDKGGSKELFHLVTLAFETLVNKQSREVYDSLHSLRGAERRPKDKSSCERPAKHRQRCFGTVRARSNSAFLHKKTKTIGKLRCVLQSMVACQRREAISDMDPCVRQALSRHMKQQQQPAMNNRKTKTDQFGQDANAYTPKSGAAGVHKFGRLYRAYVAVANMEIYSRLQSNVEEAIEDHVILTQVRDVIVVAMLERRSDDDLIDMVRKFLVDCNTSEDDIQLRAKIRVRATEWMGALRISSHMLLFENAIHLRSKILRAKRSSWQDFRAVCISLLQRDKRDKVFRGRAIKRTLTEAEIVTDKAWAAAELKRRTMDAKRYRLFWRLVRSVKSTLEEEADRSNKVKAGLRRIAERKAKVSLQRTQDELRRWHRRSDLTMEEIIRGPPAHLRQGHVQTSFV
jgi:hypothetical protein|mmetsp:Transcript_49903/g.79268  ORF Transcript_49903/g.79268 Transcript_49903/m.79268 type:complete len:431 (-) Transcript_49903:51-1343(-)